MILNENMAVCMVGVRCLGSHSKVSFKSKKASMGLTDGVSARRQMYMYIVLIMCLVSSVSLLTTPRVASGSFQRKEMRPPIFV